MRLRFEANLDNVVKDYQVMMKGLGVKKEREGKGERMGQVNCLEIKYFFDNFHLSKIYHLGTSGLQTLGFLFY